MRTLNLPWARGAVSALALGVLGLGVLTPRALSAPSGNGDTNGDGIIDLADVVHLLAYMYEGGSPPAPLSATSTAVPIGTVVDWLAPDGITSIPDGFVVCNGAVVADPQSPFDGFAVPDLVGRFVRGAATIDDIGNLAGAETHSHELTHSHDEFLDVSPACHQHEVAHFEPGPLRWVSGNGAVIIDYTNGVENTGSGHFPLSAFPTLTDPAYATDAHV
ncbi:MAG: hypothetical protein KDC38_18285, partial [Planctomycetes bacterium]|nr:hypothetical protein [Planctomycetota bacterium]